MSASVPGTGPEPVPAGPGATGTGAGVARVPPRMVPVSELSQSAPFMWDIVVKIHIPDPYAGFWQNNPDADEAVPVIASLRPLPFCKDSKW